MINTNKMAELIYYENAGHGIHDEEREKFCDDFTRFIKKIAGNKSIANSAARRWSNRQ